MIAALVHRIRMLESALERLLTRVSLLEARVKVLEDNQRRGAVQ